MGRGRGARVENTRRARAVLAVVVTLVIGLGCRGGRREDGERIVSSASLADVEAVFGREALYGKRRTRHTSHISGTYGTYDQHSHHDHHGIRHKSTEPGRSHVSDPPYDARRAASYFATMAKYKAAGLDGLGGRTVRTGDSRVRRTKALPSGKLAFMFLTDKVMPGWEAWGTFFATASDDEYNVYVNANPGVANAQKGIFANKVIKHSIATTWGTFSIVEATIGLLRHALAQDMENERFILVSDNTLPVASFQSVRCTLLAERRSLINACDLTKHDREAKSTSGHDSLIRMPHDFPPWLNSTVWRKSSQWFVLNRKHAHVVSTGELSMKVRDEFQGKCVAPVSPGVKQTHPNARSCYGDEHYFATVLATHGLDYETTCSEGVTFVNWETYESGHPKDFNSVSQFLSERDTRPRVALMSCGGRLDPPAGSLELGYLETTGCAAAAEGETIEEQEEGIEGIDGIEGRIEGTKGKNDAFDDESDEQKIIPNFGECLFARKFADAAFADFGTHWGKTIGA